MDITENQGEDKTEHEVKTSFYLASSREWKYETKLLHDYSGHRVQGIELENLMENGIGVQEYWRTACKNMEDEMNMTVFRGSGFRGSAESNGKVHGNWNCTVFYRVFGTCSDNPHLFSFAVPIFPRQARTLPLTPKTLANTKT